MHDQTNNNYRGCSVLIPTRFKYETIFSLQVTSIENNYFWIQYSVGKDKPDKWTMQPKLYTALVSDFVSILPQPDLVHESGTRFFYKFQIQ